MLTNKFNNLYEFFNYLEFCPLCKSRTSTNVVFPFTTIYDVDNTDVILIDSRISNNKFIINRVSTKSSFPRTTIDNVNNQTSNNKITINLFNNNISENYIELRHESKSIIRFGRNCNKYHFFYSGTADISKDDLKISNILLYKYHFIRIHGPTHFTVNNYIEDLSTNIRITNNFITNEIKLKFIDFDLTNKKSIDNKLKNIQLLT